MNELVERLSKGDHHVEAGLRPEKTVKGLKEAIDRGYVHIKFTETKGGTELGVQLQNDLCDLTKADFENETGEIHLAGTLSLNYVKVQCVADLDLASLEGKGHLIPLEG